MKPEQERVLKTAVGILLVGFVFIFFALPFADIDLLLDPVGFVLVFNGAHALRKLAGRRSIFRLAAICSIGLVVVSAVQLFVQGALAGWILVVRSCLETALFCFLQLGFFATPNTTPKKWLIASVLWLSAAAALLRGGMRTLVLLGGAFSTPAVWVQSVSTISAVLLLIILLFTFRLYKRTT